MLPKRIEVEQILVFLNYISHCLIGKDYGVSLIAKYVTTLQRYVTLQRILQRWEK